MSLNQLEPEALQELKELFEEFLHANQGSLNDDDKQLMQAISKLIKRQENINATSYSSHPNLPPPPIIHSIERDIPIHNIGAYFQEFTNQFNIFSQNYQTVYRTISTISKDNFKPNLDRKDKLAEIRISNHLQRLEILYENLIKTSETILPNAHIMSSADLEYFKKIIIKLEELGTNIMGLLNEAERRGISPNGTF